MSIWKDKDWKFNYKIINDILPFIYLGLQEFKSFDINGDLSAKILSFVYNSETFTSPIKVNIPIIIPDAPIRPKNIRKRLFET